MSKIAGKAERTAGEEVGDSDAVSMMCTLVWGLMGFVECNMVPKVFVWVPVNE